MKPIIDIYMQGYFSKEISSKTLRAVKRNSIIIIGFLALIVVSGVHAQECDAKSFLTENLAKRGYSSNKFLTSYGKTCYYLVNTSHVPASSQWNKRYTIVAIHDLGKNDGIGVKGKNEEIQDFMNELLPVLPYAAFVSISHYVIEAHLGKIDKYEENYKPQGAKQGEIPIKVTNYYSIGDGKFGSNVSPNLGNTFIEAQNKIYGINEYYSKPIEKRLTYSEKKAIAKKKNKEILAKFYKENGYEIKERDYWSKFGRASNFLQGLYIGDFYKVRSSYETKGSLDYFSVAFLDILVSRISKNCEHLLSKNYVEKQYEVFIQGRFEDQVTFPFGDMTPLPVGNVREPNKINKYKFRMHPKFVSEHEKAFNLIFSASFQVKAWGGLGSSNPLATNNIMVRSSKGIADFFIEIGCDTNMLHLMGENILRFRKGEKSVQEELGVDYEYDHY